MNVISASMLLLGAVAIPHIAFAAQTSGTRFEHKDWQLVCDNTGTCRAAGYQAEDEKPAVSLMLVRSAGARQDVTGQVQLGSYEESDSALSEGVSELAISANGRRIGEASYTESDAFTVPRAALPALMAALQQSSGVTFSSGKKAWKLSTTGASAVLLKMDEVQGRIGTVGAIVRKGTRSEEGVPKPVPAPVIIAAPVSKDSKEVVLAPVQRIALLKELRRVTSAEDCSGLHGALSDQQEPELALHRLSATRLVASVGCELGAYNESSRFWVINAAPPFAPVIAADYASDYEDGEITSAHKGRGLGDCWSAHAWTWDGTRFVKTGASTSGMCRLVAAGGAWSLPTYVATVRKPGAKAR